MIVLATHVWYWWVNADHDRLSKAQTEALSTAPHVGVSAVSCFEMAHAVCRGRIELNLPMREWFAKALDGLQVELLALTPVIAERAVRLSDHHRDPFDRLIIATALELNGQLASVDGKFSAYPELAGCLLA